MMKQALCFILGNMPLPLTHGLGAILGVIIFLTRPKLRSLLLAHLHQSRLYHSKLHCWQIAIKNTLETGKTFLETFPIWFAKPQKISKWMSNVDGWEYIEQAQLNKRGIIFLTPHLGCYEITSLFYGKFSDITVMYRLPKQSWLNDWVRIGRTRKNIHLVPTNFSGIKHLFSALQNGQAIGILPDQVPQRGQGEYAPFFHRSAYTMTLVSRLAQKTSANILMAWAERLSWGRGYHLHIFPLTQSDVATPALLNQQIESVISRCPEQYLWCYKRYK